MNTNKLPEKIYFVGAGGIGMANLVRYYLRHGVKVAGYDRTSTLLTDNLRREGAQLTFEDSVETIPLDMRGDDTLVVYTPAVPPTNNILSYFRNNGNRVIKRAALLGEITRSSDSICVAGSHGKTTTSSMIANILRQSHVGCTAFLGGVLRNTESNLVLQENSPVTVIEADEYDRSFLHLTPHIAVITSTDPDHLDIYGDEEHYLEAFSHFTTLIRPGGYLVLHTGLKMTPATSDDVKVTTYSGGHEGDWHSSNIRYGKGKLVIDIEGPGIEIKDISLGVPVEINIDNAVAAAAASILTGATADEVKRGLEDFKGAHRRFEILLDGNQPDGHVLIDDYAHSPNEIRASIRSVRKLYKDYPITVIFQPHLYTRTRDFAADFAEALSEADTVIMPEIYPAREEPIEGITTHTILDAVKSGEKIYCERKDLLNLLKNSNFGLIMTLGAADLDVLLPEIRHIMTGKAEPALKTAAKNDHTAR